MDNLCPKYDEEFEKVLNQDFVVQEEKRNEVMDSYGALYNCFKVEEVTVNE
jgi:hypothetical protein